MVIFLTIITYIHNTPWYIAEYIEKLTGFYPERFVDFFGAINNQLLEGLINELNEVFESIINTLG